jgi:hypothetical protein
MDLVLVVDLGPKDLSSDPIRLRRLVVPVVLDCQDTDLGFLLVDFGRLPSFAAVG